MSGPRKIVLILGNGFDLDLGLKTSYKDFWESEFCPTDYPAPLIHHLNQCWPDKLDAIKWYDLENEFLKYYNEIAHTRRIPDIITPEEKNFITIVDPACLSYGIDGLYYEAFNTLFQKGILKENPNSVPTYILPYREDLLKSSIWRDRKALELIKERLCNYLKSIVGQGYNRESVALNVLFAAEKAKGSGDFLNIYTFNYTELPVDYGDGFKDNVHYVHGSRLNGNIIIGTRDDQAIDSNYDFLQKSFDPHYNPPALVADLLEADEVIIFGHSIGENDRQYFKAFFKQQTDYAHTKRKGITIFTKDETSEIQIKRSIQQMTDGNLSTLFGLNHIQMIRTASITEDQEKLFKFMINHHIEKQEAEIQIGRLLHTSR